MAKVSLKGVTHYYTQEVRAVSDVDWTVPNGTFAALLGPSGCGKTTLMKIISGLLTPTKGKVFFDGRDVVSVPTERRNVCMVFQFPVVYAGMNVFGNLAFPLQNEGIPKGEIKERVIETADILGIRGILKASVGDLGPGDRQKVSLGRAIIREEPNVIMLDEPLTDVEPESRFDLRRRLKEIQKRVKSTTIYVTHDQTEALTLAEKVAVMRGGKIIQYGSGEELYSDPKNTFVGYFIGSPGMNFLDFSLSDSKMDFGNFALDISKELRSFLEQHGNEFQLGVRPGNVQVSGKKKKGWIGFKVSLIEHQGTSRVLTLSCGKIQVRSRVSEDFKVSEGDKVWVHFPEDRRKVYKKSGDLLV